MLLFDDTAGDEHVKLRAQKALMFKSLGDETRDINGSQTETVGGDERSLSADRPAAAISPNATHTITLNVGADRAPMTQISMTTSQIQLSVGDISFITMTMDGILLSVGPTTSIALTPASVVVTSPTITVAGSAAVNIGDTTVNMPCVVNVGNLVAASAVVSGVPV